MLKNISEVKQTIKYNLIEINVDPQGLLDCRDFRIQPQEIPAIQKRIMLKNPGVFEVVDVQEELGSSKESFERIQFLEKVNARLTDECQISKDALTAAEAKMADVLQNESGYKEQISDLKGQVKELKAKLKAAQ